jgi:hypothetical protein
MIGAGVVVVVVAWLAYFGVSSLSAYRHDKDGLALLEQVRSDLSPGQLTSSTSVRLLDQAEAQFAAAHSDLSSPVLAPVSVVPVIGRQYRSVKALSSAAGTVSSVGSNFLSEVHTLLNQPQGAGTDRVASLRRLAAVSASSAEQLAHVDTGPSSGLISPLARKYNQFVSQLDDARRRLTDAAGVSAAVATILEGPQNYLVLATNNAEMRSGSGSFLDVGVATTGQGSVHLEDFSPSGDHILAVGQVPVTGDLQRNWGWLHPSLDFRNLGLTPQFDVTAPLAARMWTSLTGQSVDGVLSIDVVGLTQLLQTTGPVVVDGQTVTAGNAEQFLLHDQYVGLTYAEGNSTARQGLLGDLAHAVLSQLQGQTADLKSLASSVSGAVAGRHLMVWSEDPATQAVWVDSGVSGSLAPNSLDVSLINIRGNKLDPYVPIKVAVHTAPSGSGTAVTMTTQMTNDTPPGLSQYAAGPYPGDPTAYGTYIGLVTSNLPTDARHITVTGGGPLAVKGGEGPTWVLASPVTLAPGASATVVTRFILPGAHGTMAVVPSARVPAEQWTAGGTTHQDTAPFDISW